MSDVNDGQGPPFHNYMAEIKMSLERGWLSERGP